MLPFEIAELVRWLVSTCRGGNPVTANTEASEVWSGMFAPPQCPADWLTVDHGGGGIQILRGQAHSLHGAPACRPSRSWETSQLDFEPWRQNFEANTGGKLPNHVFHLSSLSQIPLQMFEQTAPFFKKLSVSCACVSTVSIYESLRCCLWSVFVKTIQKSQKRNTACVIFLLMYFFFRKGKIWLSALCKEYNS